jgi:hypothetical protein
MERQLACFVRQRRERHVHALYPAWDIAARNTFRKLVLARVRVTSGRCAILNRDFTHPLPYAARFAIAPVSASVGHSPICSNGLAHNGASSRPSLDAGDDDEPKGGAERILS